MPSWSSARTLAAILVVAIAVGGCGFKLRGKASLPESLRVIVLKVAITAVHDELVPYLEQSGVTTVEAGSDVPYDAVLHVGPETISRRVLSVSPSTGRAREYELAYVFSYRFVDADGKALVDPGSVRLLRDYIFDDDQVIGKSREEYVLRNEMRRDAIRQLLRRLEAAL
jgi:LPS-assembly lipoprotein